MTRPDTPTERRNKGPLSPQVDPRIVTKTEELLAVLDVEAQYLQAGLDALDQMRSWVIRRDDGRLADLLDRIKAHTSTYATHEQRRQVLRQDLADLVGCPATDLTLSRLETALPEALRRTVRDKKTALRRLAERVRHEHRLAALLLADCARFNRALFRAIFHQGKDRIVTYGATGKTLEASGSPLMKMAF